MAFRMRDVAQRAGVSVTTVSHVLNKTPHRPVAPETRQRILDAVRELDYHADANARRLAQNRSNLFGLIVSEIANPFFPEVIRSFEDAALGRGFDLLLANTEYDPVRSRVAVRKMLENKVRAVAVVTSMLEVSYADQLAAEKIPVVVLAEGPTRPGVGNINVNFAQGMAQAVAHLIELGHREVAFVAGPQGIRSAARVRDAFIGALARRGLQPHRIVESNYKVDGGAAAVRSLMEQAVFPTAIVCGNDLIAVGVVSALEEVGISVPGDVSVVGCDNILVARLARPPLTTIDVSREALGKLAFQALHGMLRRPTRPGSVYQLETSLVVRKSTAPRAARKP